MTIMPTSVVALSSHAYYMGFYPTSPYVKLPHVPWFHKNFPINHTGQLVTRRVQWLALALAVADRVQGTKTYAPRPR